MSDTKEPAKSFIGDAWEIAHLLETKGFSGVDGALVLAMALGIFCEGQPDSHRGLKPLVDGVLTAAQGAFDALRASRDRDEGNA